MLIDSYQLKSVTPNVIRCEWDATDLNKTCWFYRNGELIDKIKNTNTLSRSVEFSIEQNTSSVIEIHEVSDGENVRSINIARSSYEVHWYRVEDAAYYLIYHSVEDGGEILLQRINQNPEDEYYFWTTPPLKWIDGVWHHFRVEAVNIWEKRSTTKAWHYFVYGMPSQPSDVSITGTGGLFKVELTF